MHSISITRSLLFYWRFAQILPKGLQQLIIIANLVANINLALKYLGESWRSFSRAIKVVDMNIAYGFEEKDNRNLITVGFDWNAE